MKTPGFRMRRALISRIARRTLSISALLMALRGASYAQTLTVGGLPASTNYVFARTGLVAVANSMNAAAFDGQLDHVTFRWSKAPCPGAVSIATYHFYSDSLPPSQTTFGLVQQRGPFDVMSLEQTMAVGSSAS